MIFSPWKDSYDRIADHHDCNIAEEMLTRSQELEDLLFEAAQLAKGPIFPERPAEIERILKSSFKIAQEAMRDAQEALSKLRGASFQTHLRIRRTILSNLEGRPCIEVTVQCLILIRRADW